MRKAPPKGRRFATVLCAAMCVLTLPIGAGAVLPAHARQIAALFPSLGSPSHRLADAENGVGAAHAGARFVLLLRTDRQGLNPQPRRTNAVLLLKPLGPAPMSSLQAG